MDTTVIDTPPAEFSAAVASARNVWNPTARTERAAELLTEVNRELEAARTRRNLAGRTLWLIGLSPEKVRAAMGINRGGLVKFRKQWATEVILAQDVLTPVELGQKAAEDRDGYLSLLAEYERKAPPGWEPVANAQTEAELAGATVKRLSSIAGEVLAIRHEAMAEMLKGGARPVEIANAGQVSRGWVAQMGLRLSDAQPKD